MKYIFAFEENNITYIKGKQKGSELVIYDLKTFSLSEDWSNFSYQKQVDEIYSALAETVAALKLKNKKVELILSSKGMMFRELMLPKVRKSQLHSLINNELQYYYNNIDDYVVDFIETEKYNNEGKHGYIVYAIRKDNFKVLVNALEKLSLKVDSANVICLSFKKLANFFYGNEKNYVTAIFDKEYFAMFCYENQNCVLMRWFKINAMDYWNGEAFSSDKLSEQVARIIHFGRSRNPQGGLKTLFIVDNLGKEESIAEVLKADLEKNGIADVNTVLMDLTDKIVFKNDIKPEDKNFQLYCSEIVKAG
ncbi:MAG: hypothetical protein RR315_01995 [Oscillospiraceae bacterium]